MTNIFVNRTNNKNIAYLFFKNKKISCFVGKNGIGYKKKEGILLHRRGFIKPSKCFIAQINLIK